jgi:YihY family inner membrane protein
MSWTKSPQRRLRGFGRFWKALAKKTIDDAIPVEASALAFGTVLSMVPLLAAFLWVGRHAFTQYREQVLNALQQFLPYTEETLLTQITQFLDQAEAIQGIGIISFAVVTIMTFAGIEATLNRIWNVTASRSLKLRMTSFVLLLVFGPLLIGAAYSILAYLRTQTTFDRLFSESLFLRSLPFFVTAFGLSMLYWLVPNTAVRKRAAVTGGLAAGLLLEGLRAGFGFYLSLAPGLSLVYGGFALALFFMISIQLAWFIVLVGCEIAYGVQHRGWMSESATTRGIDTGWLAVAALVNLGLRAKQDTGRWSRWNRWRHPDLVRHEALADDLQIPADEVRPLIAPLVQKGWVQTAGFRDSSYRLATDLNTIDVAEVLRLYWLPDQALADAVPNGLEEGLLNLREQIRGNAPRTLGPVAQLLTTKPNPAVEAQLPLPTAAAPQPNPKRDTVEIEEEEATLILNRASVFAPPGSSVVQSEAKDPAPPRDLAPELEVTRLLPPEYQPKDPKYETGELLSLTTLEAPTVVEPVEPKKEDLDETMPVFRGDDTLPVGARIRKHKR